MWRRFGGTGQQQPLYSKATLFDPTYDDGYLETIQEVESIISRQSSIRHPSQLPELPFRSVPPLQHDRASSIYSQTNPATYEDAEKTPSGGRDDLSTHDITSSEVSSLTAHSSVDNDSRSSPPISPLFSHFLENTIPARQEHSVQSQLSRLVLPDSRGIEVDQTVHEYRLPRSAEYAEKRSETRWADFSGEPTNSETGKLASVRPGVTRVEQQYPQLKEKTRQILAELRKRDLAEKPDQEEPARPVDILENRVYQAPWQGASGTVELAEQVKNTPAINVEPLRIPQRNASRIQAHSNDAIPVQNTQPKPSLASSPKSSYSFLDIQQDLTARKERTIRAVASQDSIKPIVPLKLGSNNTSRVVSPITPTAVASEHMNSLQSPFKSPQHTFLHMVPGRIAGDVDQELVESPTDNEPLTPTTPTLPNNSYRPRTGGLLRSESEEAHVSRFSWTTYTTTEHGSPTAQTFDSPDAPTVPSMPSIMRLHKRPVPSQTDHMLYINSNAASSNGSIVVRKPVPTADRDRSSSMNASPSLGKSLPQCPPEFEASDKISTLEARLDDLARRKRNINKIKATLADSLRRNAVAYGAQKRKEVETKLKDLDDEMSEVIQEEHEVGLRLHRAQKRRDREENNLNPTTLWIKRVTS